MIKNRFRFSMNIRQIWKYVKWVLFAALMATYVILCVAVDQKNAKIREYRQQVKELTAKANTKPAEVQCTVELNIKSNKNGIMIIDANQQAQKIADEISKKLK